MNVFRLPMEVRFRDLDAMGHVNNAEYFTYVAETRRFFLDALAKESGLGCVKFILAHIQCDFIKPVQLDSRIMVELWVISVGEKSFRLAYRITDVMESHTLYAKGESIQVCYDYEKQLPVSVSDALRFQLSKFLSH